ncbi:MULTISPECIES: MetQ/NlpA family ABC transporter substrate-binding protein [Pseudomonas]|jgi:D-methionine transport system substrate-binding protein|uniref:D-methionine transport system substrate-binding protein n=2 Tax=Pseudomonas fluorescens TaxID=294 RepID=A0ABY1TAS0_PSEFL|nr:MULTISPECIES: MetQ/NlpA family ABC transporter substrate-binding protein [Pseudomonas]MEA3171849.1 D-methionine transport system substrate-binding protein [Pseudomonas sp.]MBC8787145.1 MetQ/NlpA family ABC transporter substrate-binding protein [Pseudomonas fluorescens]MBK5546036.1 MetQ/NlpA family ABC transporter substrate-binding protein [Pseudomonas sp. TH04]MCI4603978.1 MetQ/NlpA family ABC transporter substrate-binding protein [Pseudomonas fluorescens]MDD5443769.1 MetQ/NlpA family ABC t
MKKVLLFTALAAALTASFAQANEKLVVAATPIPHAEILELVKPTLAKEGVDLEIKVFTDYVQPNTQVAEKRLDANYFQTLPYLENFNKGKGTNLVTVIGVHVEPIGGYSKKIKNISELKDGATVAIPNEGSNSGRALLLLQKNGLITLKDPSNALSTPKDIASNPKHLKFKELESALLPRVLDQVDLDVINTNYALEAGLNPAKDALIIEDAKSPYVNFLVARPDNKDSDAVQKLAKALTSPEVKAFIEKKYNGAVVPAF